jgi:SNF2 family DNA or RNA helicase
MGKRGDPRSVAMRKLQALLKATMLRRMKSSMLDGKPIIQLPPKDIQVVHVVLNEDELGFYKDLEQHSQVQINKYLRAGTVGKNYTNILVLLLRLRQACCHPHLNLDVEETAGSLGDEQMESLAKHLGAAVVERLKAHVDDAFECPICYDAVPDPSIIIPCGHDSCAQCVSRILDNSVQENIRQGAEERRARCPVCRGSVEANKVITFSIFKKVHMPELVSPQGAKANEDGLEEEETSTEDETEEEDSDSDYSDTDDQGNLKGFIVPDDEAYDDEEDDNFGSKLTAKKPKKGKKAKGKGKSKQADVKPLMLKALRKDAAKNHESFKRYMRYLRKNWLPSAKVSKCVELLTEIQKSGEKTIVFSQWTMLLDLIEVAIKLSPDLNVQHCRYDGAMNTNQRDVSATRFRDDPNVKIMLVSLRAGNAGLNLVAASRVIIMDPFWNPYIENQAVDRAYRIGQQRPVQVYRILVKDTVEDRIVDLQEKKREIVEAALDEGGSRSVGRLTQNELMYLFNVGGSSRG